MNPLRRLLLSFTLVTVGFPLVVSRNDKPQPPVRIEQIRAGMTPKQVRDLLGPPHRVARQIYYQGYLEQWVYDRPLACRISFLYRLGKEAQIQSVHPISQRKR